jgi:antitoxin (DNA-binding transcriptional repressor) of toxin-antitoxin stability system
MDTFKIHAAKTQFSRLMARVEAGEEIAIARGDKVIARILPAQPATAQRRSFGVLSGRFAFDEDAFLEPLPAAELRRWGVREPAAPYKPGRAKKVPKATAPRRKAVR